MPHSQALEMFKITKDFILISDYYDNNIINGLQYSMDAGGNYCSIVWVLLLGVHYLDMLLELKLPPHVPNLNKLSVSCSWNVI